MRRFTVRPLHRLIALSCTLLFVGACGGPIDEAPAKARDFFKKLRPTKPTRACFDHEECFAGEYCAEGTCKPYEGRTVGRAVDRPDLDSYLYDLGEPEDMGAD